jgi:hypothetical protein
LSRRRLPLAHRVAHPTRRAAPLPQRAPVTR